MQYCFFKKITPTKITILRALIFCAFFIVSFFSAKAQNAAPYVYGTITDMEGSPLPGVIIQNARNNTGTSTDGNGYYTLTIQEGALTVLQYRLVGYQMQTRTVNLRKGDVREINIELPSDNVLSRVVISDKGRRAEPLTRISPKNIEVLPSATGGVEAILRTMPGVVSNNELSAQYSVRGGNFDENLVYVNDFEIYRPFLIRSGQQEGLSFINPDLVGSIAFSAGGFSAKYGDKMASVLDVKYKRPNKTHASVGLSLLGGTAHIEGTNRKKTFSYLMGARHKSNQYLLKSLPTQGQYRPSFSDFQALVNYHVGLNWQLQGIGNFAHNVYNFIPKSAETDFGTFQQPLRLTIAFDGAERDRYTIGMAGLSGIYTSTNNKLTLKFLTSAYRSQEIEAYNIVGGYYIGVLEKNLNNANFGELSQILGAGITHQWARNQLNATIANAAHIGNYAPNNQHLIMWSVKYQNEQINDRISKWSYTDSAGYTIPYNGTNLVLGSVLKSNIALNSNRISGFLQHEWALNPKGTLNLNTGVRANYWDLNKQMIVSPRVQFSYKKTLNPNDTLALYERSWVWRIALGAYHQPPFYRELRSPQGIINYNLKAQQAWHAVLGTEYDLTMWNRPFKFTAEAYYKHLQNLVSYDIDNLLLQYAAKNNAKGYATGIDMRLSGEFVADNESWVSLSMMRTRENLDNDHYYDYYIKGRFIGIVDSASAADSSVLRNIGYIPRPTDQFLNFGMFFQDHLRNNKNFKVHLMLLFGTGMAVGPPTGTSPKFRNAFRLPFYRRVDIGFSALLFDAEKKEIPARSPLKIFRSLWASAEIFNLLGVQNTVSYSWIQAVGQNYSNQRIAVPNYLTNRTLNLRLIAKF